MRGQRGIAMKKLGLAVASVFVALIAIIPQGARADIGTTSADVGTLVQQLFQKYDPVFDGTLTIDDPPPLGDTIHVVDRDNKDAWKIQVDTGGAVTFDNEMSCDISSAPPLPPGALHLVVFPGDSHAYLRSTRYHRTYLRDLTRLDYHA